MVEKEEAKPAKEKDDSAASNAASDDDDEFSDDEKEKSGPTITWAKLVVFSLSLLFLLHFSTHFWMDHLGRGSIGAVFSFYALVMVYIFLPIPSNRWLRKAFIIVLQRCFELVNPRCSCFCGDSNGPRPIPFIDVFFADAMCSLSKVFFDWGLLFHMASHYPNPVPASAHNILIPSACAAVPFIIRARQCLIMYTVGRLKVRRRKMFPNSLEEKSRRLTDDSPCKNCPSQYQHLANALKYTTSIFPLCLSAYQKTIDPEKAKNLEPHLIFLLTWVFCWLLWITQLELPAVPDANPFLFVC